VNAVRCKTTSPVATVGDSSYGSGILPVAAIMPPTKISAVLEGDSGDLLKDSDDSVSMRFVPFSIPHYRWECAVDGMEVEALIDNGSHTVLVRSKLVDHLNLHCQTLHKPMNISLALSDLKNHVVTTLTEWVKLKLYDRNNLWCSRTVRAVVMLGLCADIILGLSFLQVNRIVADHGNNTCIALPSGYDLLNPPLKPNTKGEYVPLQRKHRELHNTMKVGRKSLIKDLKSKNEAQKQKIDVICEPVKDVDIMAAIRAHIKVLADKEKLLLLDSNL